MERGGGDRDEREKDEGEDGGVCLRYRSAVCPRPRKQL